MPFRAGEFGGALYIFMVVAFCFLLAIPVLLTEYAVGRGSAQSIAKHYHVLQPAGTKWHLTSYFCIAGNYLLMMFYIVICGFALGYFIKGITGELIGQSPEFVTESWRNLTASAPRSVALTVAIIAGSAVTCFLGVQKGVERASKYMMGMFFVLIIILIVRSMTLPNAYRGLQFLFVPNLNAIREHGFWRVVHMAMGQALFSLSVGMGSMAIFGSYFKKEKRLFGEAFTVGVLDLAVVFLCLLMIFPAAFAFDIPATAGEGLLFVTLPNIFNQMPASYLWSLLFYAGLVFVSFTTAMAVIENIVAIGMDKFGWSRKKSVIINFVLLTILCLPSALTRNVWASFRIPLAPGAPGVHIGAFFGFIVSNIVLPVGALIYVLFCTSKLGWGWKNFLAEANTGNEGWKFPTTLRFYVTYIVPAAIFFILVFGLLQHFGLTRR
jgi:NSS family neurotransmitter:Na+ symporter